MSRSRHTDPKPIRAARRVRAPREPRGAGDLRLLRAALRELKARGVLAEPAQRAEPGPDYPLPRIVVHRPRPGFFHPAGKAAIAALLRRLGEVATYGVRRIELVRGEGSPAEGRLVLGRLEAPGTIWLYDLPRPPWRLPGRLAAEAARELAAAGAVVDVAPDGVETRVDWPGASLRDWVLFEGLAHEIGHHQLQHHLGQRRVRTARTSDHEAFAQLFVRRCREACLPGRR